MKLAPYPEYKDSGVPWLEKIPAHWEAVNLKRVVGFNPSKSETQANLEDEEKVVFLPMQNISVSGDIDCSEKRALSEVWDGFTYFRRGDVVVAKITPCFENGKGAYLKGLESDFGFGTTELIVLRPSKAIDGAFLRFLTSTKKFLLLGSQYMTGAAGQQRIPSDFVKNYPIGLPSIDEQQQIVSFLNDKTVQIKKFIRNKQRLIELLKEQKQNVINQAVTRGLDPNVKLKSSGVEWIGDIPEHWQVRRLKFLCRNLNEQTFEKKPGDIYIALEHVESWTGRISLSGDESIFDSQVKRFQPDDVLFGKLRPYLAKVAKPKIAGICVGEFLVLRATENISPEFLEQKLRSKCIIDLINSSTFGAKMPRADWKFIGSMKFSYPSANEQGEILEHIQKKSAKIDQAITRAQREIELIQEYRIRLISDVVTGQVNVRGIEAPELAREALLLLNEGVGDRCSIL